MSQELLSDVLIGVVLAGLFSATMSTADSQILSCSAAFTRDIIPKEKDTLIITKITTALVTIVALIIALYGGQNVFELVVLSWSVLAASFGPLLFLYSLDKKISELVAILMVVNGFGMTLLWRLLGLSPGFYEVGPGILAGLLTYIIASKTQWNNTAQT